MKEESSAFRPGSVKVHARGAGDVDDESAVGARLVFRDAAPDVVPGRQRPSLSGTMAYGSSA
jgi:hypothetical protein